MNVQRETDAVAERYARRAGAIPSYGMTRPEVWQTVFERQRAMLRLFGQLGWTDLTPLHAIEVGCGAGGNLLELLRFGFAPEKLTGIELLPERLSMAAHVLPAAVQLIGGDASTLPLPSASVELVLQFTVFSSLLDDGFQQRLADAMWSWVAPGGGVLWYDFTFDNPRNPDVRGVPLRRVRELFPHARLRCQRVTLAPPLARVLCRIHPTLYTLAGAVPLMRTHILAWLAKD